MRKEAATRISQKLRFFFFFFLIRAEVSPASPSDWALAGPRRGGRWLGEGGA